MINYLYNSAAFIKIFRSTALFALMGFFIAACNQEATSVKEEGTAAPSTYSAQSMAQARREAQEEKNADRDLNRYKADLELKATQIRAEQEAKNQFDTQASNLESERVRQQGENYRADKAASAQTMGSVTNALGNVISNVGPSMVQASADKKRAELESKDRGEARADRKGETLARNALENRRLDLEYGVGEENGGKGKSWAQQTKEDLEETRRDLRRALEVKKKKGEIDAQAALIASATGDAKTRAQQELLKIAAPYEELGPLAQEIVAENQDNVRKINAAFDPYVDDRIRSLDKKATELFDSLPPRDQKAFVEKNSGPRSDSSWADGLYQSVGINKPQKPNPTPVAKATPTIGLICDENDLDCDSLGGDELAKFLDDFKGLAGMADTEYSQKKDKVKSGLDNFFATLKSHQTDPLILGRIEVTQRAFNNIFNKLGEQAFRDKYKGATINGIAGMYSFGRNAGAIVAVDSDDVVDIAERMNRPALASANPIGSDWLTHPGSRDSSAGGSADDFYNIRPSTPTIGSSGGMGS